MSESARSNTRAGTLNELFTQTRRYRTGREFRELLDFTLRFRAYAPYNCMLLHVQRPGAVFVAPASRWQALHGRQVRPGETPLLILQPMGPVMFVFDVSQTVADDNAPQIPLGVEAPFSAQGSDPGQMLQWIIENAKRDGVRTSTQKAGSQSGGSIRTVADGGVQKVTRRERPKREEVDIPVRFDVFRNLDLDSQSAFAIIVHELAHLYCGHLGTPNQKWWPDRQWVPHVIEEFEAESVAWIVCGRTGITPASASYLATFLDADEIPDLDLDLVLKSANAIEQMTRGRLPLR